MYELGGCFGGFVCVLPPHTHCAICICIRCDRIGRLAVSSGDVDIKPFSRGTAALAKYPTTHYVIPQSIRDFGMTPDLHFVLGWSPRVRESGQIRILKKPRMINGQNAGSLTRHSSFCMKCNIKVNGFDNRPSVTWFFKMFLQSNPAWHQELTFKRRY